MPDFSDSTAARLSRELLAQQRLQLNNQQAAITEWRDRALAAEVVLAQARLDLHRQADRHDAEVNLREEGFNALLAENAQLGGEVEQLYAEKYAAQQLFKLAKKFCGPELQQKIAQWLLDTDQKP